MEDYVTPTRYKLFLSPGQIKACGGEETILSVVSESLAWVRPVDVYETPLRVGEAPARFIGVAV